MMELSGVRNSYDTRLTNSDLSLSDASSASLRSRNADSMRKRSVASTKVTSVAPSGSGAIESEMMAPSERSASPHSRRRSGAAAVTVEITISHTRSRPNRVAQASAMRLRCGSPASSAGSRRQMRANAALYSFNLSVRSEHRNTLLESVERRLLNLDQRVVGAFQAQLIAHVLVEEDQAAERDEAA